MNMNMIMQQAQKMQKDMQKAQEEVSKQIFTGKQELVEVEVTGDKRIKKINILNKNITSEDLEILEDMILLATNDALDQADKKMEEKLGKFGKEFPGLF